jgi:predicted nucleic acid-binding protein
MTAFFLDTSYIIALETADDQNHAAAMQHWLNLRGTAIELVTTSYVFDEIVTFFNSRNRHAKAVEVGNRLLGSPSVKLIHIDEALFFQGWQYFQQHQDKSYSLTDSISFLVMEQNKLNAALTFDQHFVQAGFEKLPG